MPPNQDVAVVLLADGAATVDDSMISDPVVEVALRRLTPLVRGAKPQVTLDDSRDRSMIKEALLALGGGHNLEQDEIRAWVPSNGWRDDAADQLGKWVATLNAGRTIRPSDQRLRADFLEQCRVDAGVDTSPRRTSRAW
jgi:hypothetical protein